LFDSVLEDVKAIRNHPLIPSNIPIYGYIFDVLTGDLIPVPKAIKAGRAKPLYCKK
jgi:carbonic anhydrase